MTPDPCGRLGEVKAIGIELGIGSMHA